MLPSVHRESGKEQTPCNPVESLGLSAQSYRAQISTNPRQKQTPGSCGFHHSFGTAVPSKPHLPEDGLPFSCCWLLSWPIYRFVISTTISVWLFNVLLVNVSGEMFHFRVKNKPKQMAIQAWVTRDVVEYVMGMNPLQNAVEKLWFFGREHIILEFTEDSNTVFLNPGSVSIFLF